MKQFSEAALLSIVAVFAPIKPLLASVLVLVFADLVMGLWAAKKRGEKISSSGLRRTVTKIMVYQIAIMLGFLCETYLLSGLLPVTKLLSALIGVVELKSIFESLDTVNGSPLFAEIIRKLGSTNDKSS